ncbi:S-methyl-5-thioribose-1-phosphate isomerase [Halomonas sp. GXIMD04776]|uniref:S-methyl-5-thioribose-1-phosphate isomerase n=1 Tax=Halomonas sp. GXIMD04776 TaxID=3415605 RepID=UPI003CADD6C9
MTTTSIDPIRWCDDALELLDQRVLPERYEWLRVRDADETAQAITSMVVRGAPAIGIAAAYGMVLAAQRSPESDWPTHLEAAIQRLADSRPTAVNLFWALSRMRAVLERHRHEPQAPGAALLRVARDIHAQDKTDNLTLGRLGSELIARDGQCSVMTHCNTGALATGGYGTALGVIRAAWAQGLITRVHVNETRPWLQGARLTAWELHQEGIPAVLAVDSAASLLMAQGEIGWLIVGADRIAANGDVANKIGTYALAVQARHHGVKVMVVAPSSTFDLALESGAAIPIETRDARELTHQGERRVAPEGIEIFNPVFDITPATLIDAIVCEHGVIKTPEHGSIERLLG